MRDVTLVNALLEIWSLSIPSVDPFYAVVPVMATYTPNINASEWKNAIDNCLQQPLKNDEVLYLLDTSGLFLTDQLVDHFRVEPSIAIHWITMVVHSYLFSASSYKMQKMSGPGSTTCESYIKTIAPFATQALYALHYVSSDHVDMARYIYRNIVKASNNFFSWMSADARHVALERIRSVKLVLGVPEAFYSPLAMDKHYSYLPEFKKPFITSILDAFKAKANHDIFTFQMSRFANMSVDTGRWRLDRTREAAMIEELYLGPSAGFVPLYMLILVPPVLVSDMFLRFTDVIFSYAGIGRVISHELMHAFGR